MSKTYQRLIILGIVIVVVVLAYGVFTMQDNRTATEKVGDAIHDLPQGVDKAARQLEDRTPGEKLGDAVKDAGDKIKDNTHP